MAVTNTEIAENIDPGSTDYGDRAGLAAGVQGLGTNPSATQAPAGAGAPLTPPANSPLDLLLQGELGKSGNPLTAGLSVGPGPGPQYSPMDDSYDARLRTLATSARSPVIRQLARNLIRSRRLRGVV
jgi:hypothetical protein